MKLALSVVLALQAAVEALPTFQHNGNAQKVLKIDEEEFLSGSSDSAVHHKPQFALSAEPIAVEAFNALPEIDTEELQSLVAEAELRERAEALYNISLHSVKKAGHPTRVIGSQGHWSTVGYIATQLHKLNGYYNVTTQKLKALSGEVNSYSLLIDGVKPRSLLALALTPATPHRRPVDGNLTLAANFGCSATDFPETVKGNIVLIQRGACDFQTKSVNAGLAGAVAAIVYDDLPLHGTLGGHTGKEVPTLSITTADARQYIDALTKDPTPKFDVTLYIDAFVKNIKTLNVIAETVHGDHDNVVALGAHSDSVGEGPGINDDGSGTISLLAVAKHLTNFKVNNAVRFAWWAAEEEGLLGSNFYAESLSPEENAKVRLFMDYDMMASPNYEYEVYDANNEEHPNGSGNLKDLYIDWYTSHGLNYTLIPFDGRSDYVGFIEAGIPAGGIATGAEGLKTIEGVQKFGGVAGEQFDQCYHQACDDLGNPDYEAWVYNTKLIAHSVATYAKSFEGFPERESVDSAGIRKGIKFAYRGPKLVM